MSDSEEKEVWESHPTTFIYAVEAWARAVECVAWPLYPAALRSCIGLTLWAYEPSSYEALAALHEEAVRRTNYVLPGRDDHRVTPRAPLLWHHQAQYGLTWESSVKTTLMRTRPGWLVRIVGQHAYRRSAAEDALVVAPQTQEE